MGFVYLIEDISKNIYKIGVTKGDPEKRLSKLQTGNSCKLSIKYLYKCKYPFRLESMLHNYYKDFKELNEWYYISNINEFIIKCEEFNSIIINLLDNPFFNKKLR